MLVTNRKTLAFLEDLKKLCRKHAVWLDSSDRYVGPDSTFGGTDYTFTGGVDDGTDERVYIAMDDLEGELRP